MGFFSAAADANESGSVIFWGGHGEASGKVKVKAKAKAKAKNKEKKE